MKAMRGLALVGALFGAGCGTGSPPRGGSPAQAPQPAAEAGFSAPPRPIAAGRLAGGAVELIGLAAPGAAVRLASPLGGVLTATADGRGAWSVRVPGQTGVAVYGLSTRTTGAPVQAEGYVAILPPPSRPAALLRAGAGAADVGGTGAAVHIDAIDFDAAGAAVVSGTAPARAPVRVEIDGQAAGEGQSGDAMTFAIPLVAPLRIGVHRVAVLALSGQADVEAMIDRPARPALGPYKADRQPGLWRIDWITPGGGLQTTLLFDPSGTGR